MNDGVCDARDNGREDEREHDGADGRIASVWHQKR
jgi:hypothetical protein